MNNKQDPLLILRFFAAFCVFYTHMFIVLKPIEINWKIYGCAHAAMVIFFTLSGYLMGKAFLSQRYSFSEDGILNFYYNRVVRIVPLCYFCFFVIVAMLVPDKLNDIWNAWRIFLFAYKWGDGSWYQSSVGAFWSLSVEMQYYMIAPFVFFIFRNCLTKKINLIFFIICCFGLIHLIRFININYFNKSIPLFFTIWGQLPYFLFGFAINFMIFDIRIEKLKKVNQNIIVIGLLLLFVVIFLILSKQNSHHYKLSLILGAFVTWIMIVVLENLRKLEIKNVLYDLLEKGGILSYGLYLWHSALGILYFKIINPTYKNLFEYFFHFLMVFVISMILSQISFLLVEKQFARMKFFEKR